MMMMKGKMMKMKVELSTMKVGLLLVLPEMTLNVVILMMKMKERTIRTSILQNFFGKKQKSCL